MACRVTIPGEFRGEHPRFTAEMNKSQRSKIANAMKKAAKRLLLAEQDLVTQDIMNALQKL